MTMSDRKTPGGLAAGKTDTCLSPGCRWQPDFCQPPHPLSITSVMLYFCGSLSNVRYLVRYCCICMRLWWGGIQNSHQKSLFSTLNPGRSWAVKCNIFNQIKHFPKGSDISVYVCVHACLAPKTQFKRWKNYVFPLISRCHVLVSMTSNNRYLAMVKVRLIECGLPIIRFEKEKKKHSRHTTAIQFQHKKNMQISEFNIAAIVFLEEDASL